MKIPASFWQPASARSEVATLLNPTRGPVDTPIRSEIFGAARFAQHGRSLGLAHQARVNVRATPFFPRLRDNMRVLREAHAYLALQDRSGHEMSPAAEWLLDNFYVVMAQAKEIHEGLPRRYFRDLPVLEEAHLAGLPRIYGVAWAFVAHTDSAFDESLLVDFLQAYQETRELTLGELWALPTGLRVVLVENLRRLSERVATTKAARASANAWCDAWKEADSQAEAAAALPELLEDLRTRGVESSFVLQVLQRLRSDVPPPGGLAVNAEATQAIQKILMQAVPDAVSAQIQLHAEQAADNLSVRNAITSLRLLGNTDWRGLVARTSLLMRQLQPCATFCDERDDTRDENLHAIERLARRSAHSELEVARTLLQLMQAPGQDAAEVCPPDAQRRAQDAPGYWLHGPGLPTLLRALGLPGRLVPWQARWRRAVTPVYLGVIAVATTAVASGFVSHAAGDASAAWLVCIALLALWPASEAVIAVLHRLISESLPPQRLPRLAFADGIPPAHRVLVVIPAMLTHLQGIHALVRQLELHYLANGESEAQFALLSDFADAPVQHEEGDRALLDAAIAALDALEWRHAQEVPPLHGRRFVLLHRERVWSTSEQCWMGWERKRGKLEQLVEWLAASPADTAPAPSPFMDLGKRSLLVAQTPYIVTLDSDTGLPPGTLRALVGVAAHPLNRPCIDANLRRVVSGYGILQPRLTTPLPERRTATPFHWLFGGQTGIDTYSATASEIYQDVFAEGSFTGKGLLHVAALHAVLSNRLPQGLILSHDLLEGSIARCAAVTDITLIEEAPLHADVAASRVHRWTRGDWQLWPVLLQWRRFDLLAIHRWKMLDNLRRSLVAPLSVALLLACVVSGAASPWAALALVAAALGAGPLLGAIAGLAPARDDLALAYFYRQTVAEVARAAGGALWGLLQMLQQAMLLLDAICIALWRLLVSRRGLLRWTTAASAQAAVRNDLPGLVLQHVPVTLTALALGAVLWWGGARWPVVGVALCVLWACAPLWTWGGSRSWHGTGSARVSTRDREYLHGVAQDTWQFFARYVGPQSMHLPPDNVQFTPHEMVAHRTSPTNMGLYLLSVACARRLGWISTEEFLGRCEQTLAAMGRLERHQGHFLNWYDTQTLQPLAPAYVSTVDSGNLCGHLEAVAGACHELLHSAAGADCDAVQYQRLRALAAQCHALALQADFRFLYDAQRRLFHIGYDVEKAQLDKSFYDLLASEARLASLWGIAKGDIPVSHWSALGRPFYALGVRMGLRSWSGSMFEYLMPSLVLQEPEGSVLERAARTAVREQQAFARQHGVPWGISESAYAASDHTLAYQYAPQGVPRLALRRTPPDELVIAPYASAMAAMFEPAQAADNLRWLERLHARTDMGFIDALDFTAERQVNGSRCVRVQTCMSHHQGMALVALTNVLLHGAPQRWAVHQGRLGAVESLLHERVPREVSSLQAPERMPRPPVRNNTATNSVQDVVPSDSALQPTLLLSNGRYSVAVRPNGAGWSRFQGADVSRWRDDALRDTYGSFVYLRRHGPGGVRAPVSLTQHPAPDLQARYQATLHSDHIHLHAQWHDMRSCCTVWVSPEDDIELRKVQLWNASSEPIVLDLLSMWEVSLLAARADEAHPAFANLFVHADWDSAAQALYFVRKPHVDHQTPLHAVHFVAHADHAHPQVLAQTDRAAWLGRNREASHPLAHCRPAQADAPMGTVAAERATGLDPVAALSVRITIPAHGSVQVTLATAVATSRDTLEMLVDRYRQPTAIERSMLMSTTFANVRLRDQGLTLEERRATQTLTTLLALLHTRPPMAGTGTDTGEAPACDHRALWRFGLSGERPLVVVDIGSLNGMPLVRALVQALRLWSWGGIVCDLAILNAEPRSYLMPLQLELQALRERHESEALSHPARAGGLYVLFAEDVTPPEQQALRLLARLYLHADGRSLARHVRDLADWHDAALGERRGRTVATPPVPAAHAVAGSAPQGAFDAGSGRYVFDVTDMHRPQRPWTNVLANAGFGAHISEAGAGYSWAGNSRLHQLTVWTNDPVADSGGEWFWLQNVRTREVWSVGAGAGAASAETVYRVEHGQGVTTIHHRRGDLEVSATWCVDAQLPLKQVRVSVRNHGKGTAYLRVVGAMEWVMGAQRLDRQTVHTACVPLTAPDAGAMAIEALLATQCDAHAGFGGATAFLAVWREGAGDAHLADWTCDRRELFDDRGQRALADRFGARAGLGLDPCAAASMPLVVSAGAHQQCIFVLGHGDTRAAAVDLASRCFAQPAQERERAVQAHWQALLGAVTVRTPDALFDALTNHWLLYQTVACRLWARAGFYQAGGAFGFRDQLQDTMALAVAAPQLLRQQLLLSASRQFVEGDVQHWWHMPTGAGVRTRCSDDLLWLTSAAARYVDVTGDAAVLDEEVPFLEGPPIPADAADVYSVPEISAQTASLYEHCARALDRSLAVGVHGLPLMGGGDWNDGMSHVGDQGRGESVWLAMFLYQLVQDFAPVALARDDGLRAQRWQAAAQGWQTALQEHAWDGEWFKRAFFDDGTPLGTHTADECRIDLIAQAWSVLSGIAPAEQQRTAMASVAQWLVDDVHGLNRLLTPPLQNAVPRAGYIQAYPPGVRENGGQYSHAGVWKLMAQIALNDADGAYRTFTQLSPAHRSTDPLQGPLYAVEPYVMAADVYTHAPYVGRGGWSWYTGSAAWMHRAAVESICGMQVRAGRVRLHPQLPSHWPSISVHWQRSGASALEFIVCRADAAELAAARVRATRELAVDEWLDTAALGPQDDCFVVVIAAAGDGAANTPPALTVLPGV